jgi:hypothetical protein
MGKRRSYQKVRGGCLTCKGRKVRCDLERPVCRNCSRLSRQCQYTELGPKHYPVHTWKTVQSVQELELMHHYTAHTCMTLSDNPALVSLWKDTVPKHAFQHAFLLQGILSIAAHHKVHQERSLLISTDLIDRANVYQQEALTVYIGLLDNVTENNCHALFAFAQLVVAISYSCLNLNVHEESKTHVGFIDSIVDIFYLLKGTVAIAIPAITWLRDGDLKAMIRPPIEETLLMDDINSEISCRPALVALAADIKSQLNDSAESKIRVESLISAIQLIYTLFLQDFKASEKLNDVVGLPIFFDSYYLELLRLRDQTALVVLAYYGVLVFDCRHGWCLENMGSRIIQTIADMIEPNLSKHLTWPLEKLYLQTSKLEYRTMNSI